MTMKNARHNENDQTKDLETRKIQSEIAKNEKQVLRDKFERGLLLTRLSLPQMPPVSRACIGPIYKQRERHVHDQDGQ